MKTLLKKLEDVMAAVAFAEAGEFETSREIMKEQPDLATSPKNEESSTWKEPGNKRIGTEHVTMHTNI